MNFVEKFGSGCEFKIPSMKVKVYGSDKKPKREYKTPEGFQLEKYVMSLYPNSCFAMRFIEDDFLVEVYEDISKKKLVEVHVGIYKEKDN